MLLPTESVKTLKMKFSIIDFFSKCNQIRSFLGIRSRLLKKSLMENFIFCAVCIMSICASIGYSCRKFLENPLFMFSLWSYQFTIRYRKALKKSQ